MSRTRQIVSAAGTLLLALLLAMFIWANATQTEDPVRTRFVELPVELVGRPANTILVTGETRQTVQVRLEGPDSALQEVSPETYSATVDLSQVPFGEQVAVPITMAGSHPGVTVSFITPETMDILLEEQVTREIPIEVDLRGSAARGHQQGEPLVEPPGITVSGPGSRVNQLNFGLVTVFLNNAVETRTETAQPIFYDQQGRVASVSGLDLSTNSVSVTIPVEESAGFADKLVTVEWVGDPAPGYRLLSVSADPPSVLVEGRQVQLNQINTVPTEPIDITGLTESFQQTAILDLPAGTSVDPDQTITVDIVIEPILTTDTVNKAPEVIGLDPDFEAILNPDEVRIVLFGPLPVLDAMTDDDVRVTLNLFGLEAGSYTVEPDVDVPDLGVEIRSVQPSLVGVTITPTMTNTNGVTNTLASLNHSSVATATTSTSGASGAPLARLPAVCLLASIGLPSDDLRRLCGLGGGAQ